MRVPNLSMDKYDPMQRQKPGVNAGSSIIYTCDAGCNTVKIKKTTIKN